MKNYFITMLCAVVMIAGLSFDVDAKYRSSSSSFRSSSSRSSSRSWGSSPSRKTTTRPATTVKRSSTTKTTIKKQPATTTQNKSAALTKTSTTKPKAKATTLTSKQLKKKNRLAAKKYAAPDGRKRAAADYRKEQASQVQKKWDREPATRPAYVPQTVAVGGMSHNVVFYGGRYGYYVGGMWTPLDYAVHMAVTDAMLSNHGYGNYRNGTVVVERHPMSTAGAIAGIVIALIVVGGIVYIVVKS